MNKIAIVTDSNSGLKPSEVEGRDIYIVPMPFLIDGEEYFEGINLDNDGFYEKLNSGCSVSTSQPSIFSIQNLWDELLKKYDHIIYMPMSSGLSASYENAKKLAENYTSKVYVIDNKRISVTLKCAVLDAEKMANDGKSVEEIVDFLNTTSMQSTIYIMVPNLKYLKKGGRLTPAVAMIGTMLNIKPVLTIQGGKLDNYVKVMSIKHAIKAMIKAMRDDMEKRFGDIAKSGKFEVFVAYTFNLDDAKKFASDLESELGVKISVIDPLSLSVACHIGPNALAVAGSIRY